MENSNRIYELRTYRAAAGQLEKLIDRFRQHTLKFFQKHRMKVEGFWVPAQNADEKIIYLLSFPNVESYESSWERFNSDQEWNEIKSVTNVNGDLVESKQSVILELTDFSPVNLASKDGIMELRYYKVNQGHLQALLTMFRDHLLSLFAKYSMASVIYWLPIGGDPVQDSEFLYLLNHPSVEDAVEGFKKLNADPIYLEIIQKAVKDAGEPLVQGVKSEYLVAVPGLNP